MVDQRNPLERLRAVNPVRHDDVAGLATTATAVALFERITAAPRGDGAAAPGPARRSARWRRRRLVPVLVALGLCSGAVAYAIANRHVSRPETAACFASADLEAAAEVVSPGRRGATAACAELWTRGVLGPPPVPPLVECVLESGVVGVFPAGPGQDPCARLGLAPVVPEPRPEPEPTAGPGAGAGGFAAFQEAVVGRFLASPCVAPEEGRAIVRQELDRAGLVGWAVRDAGPFTAGRACATLGFNSPGQEVLLVPAAPRS